METRILQQAGLTQTEGKVYLTLLDLGSSLAGEITKKSGVHRRSVYDAIERLIQKGLVSYIMENNRKYFEAANPSRLLTIVKEKEEEVKAAIPELELRFKMSKEKEETMFYRGKQAIKTVFDQQIEDSEDILVFGASSNADEIVKYYFPRYDKAREKKKINVKAIFNDKVTGRFPLCEIKYLPPQFKSHTATNIWGDKVAIILWTHEPFAILIKNKEIADSYRNYFTLMWGMAKR